MKTENTATHAPTPWRNVVLHPATILTPGQRGCDAIEIRSNDGMGNLVNDDRAQANAVLIVRAVNCHDKLVDRLNRSNEFMKQMFDLLTPAQKKKQQKYIDLAYQQGVEALKSAKI